MTGEKENIGKRALSSTAQAVVEATAQTWMNRVFMTCNSEQIELLGVGATWIPSSSQNGENHAK